MKKQLRLLLIMSFVLTFVFSSVLPVEAASAVRVTKSAKYEGGKTWAVYTGKSSSGKKVWQYISSKRAAAQVDHSNVAAGSTYVYIIDYGKLIKLKLSNGKVVLRKKLNSALRYGQTLKADAKGNFYAIPWLGTTLFKYNKNGKLLWKRNLAKTDLMWFYKLKIKEPKVTVYGDSPDSWKYPANSYYAVLNTKTGKLLKYKNPDAK